MAFDHLQKAFLSISRIDYADINEIRSGKIPPKRICYLLYLTIFILDK